MSFYTKYQHCIYDRLGLYWTVNIEDQVDHSGVVIDMTGARTSLKIEHLSQGDDIYENLIKGSKADLTIWNLTSQGDFKYLDLYAVQDQQFRISIYYLNVTNQLYWQGFIFTDNYQEPYDCTPYQVTISASDQLGILKNIDYDDSGVPYTGRKLESKIILDILSKIGLTTFTEFVNLYETDMDDAVTDSPMDQVSIDTYLFEGFTCYEVLEAILRKYNACMRCVAGAMVIYRPCELIKTTIYGRTFTGETTHSGTDIETFTSFDPVQFISRTGNITDLRDKNGGTLMVLRPIKKVTSIFNCGSKDSWLKNWDIKAETITGTGPYTVRNWSEQGSALPEPCSVKLDGELDGMLLTGYNPYPTLTNYMYQQFATHAIRTGGMLSKNLYYLEFEYLVFNSTPYDSGGFKFGIQLKSDTGGWYLQEKSNKSLVGGIVIIAPEDISQCNWTTLSANVMIVTSDAPQLSNGWQTWVRLIGNLPVAGTYTLRLGPAFESSGIYVAYRNIKFYAVTSTVAVTNVPIYNTVGQEIGTRPTLKQVGTDQFNEIKYTKTNAINGWTEEYNYILGDVIHAKTDNIIEQFAGSLAKAFDSRSETLIEAATRFIVSNGEAFSDIKGSNTGTNLIYIARVAGVDFTDSLTFTNKTGDIAGVITTLQANAAGTVQIDQVTISGTDGGIKIRMPDGTWTTMSWYGSDIEDIINNYLSIYSFEYHLVCELSLVGTDVLQIYATGVYCYTPFITEVYTEFGTLEGTVATTQANVSAIARQDQIALSGTSGTADIEYNGTTKEINIGTIGGGSLLTPTETWNSEGGSEELPLLELVAEELTAQFARPRQFLSGYPIIETATSDKFPHLLTIGSFQDDINKFTGSVNRKFVFNKGSEDINNRTHEVDLIEIIYEAPS